MKFCSVWRKKRNCWHRNAHNFVRTEAMAAVVVEALPPLNASKPLVNQLMMFEMTNDWMIYWKRCRWQESGHRRMIKPRWRRQRRHRLQPLVSAVWPVRCDWNGNDAKVFRIPYKTIAALVAKLMRLQLAVAQRGGMWRYLSKLKMILFLSFHISLCSAYTGTVISIQYSSTTLSTFFSQSDMWSGSVSQLPTNPIQKTELAQISPISRCNLLINIVCDILSSSPRGDFGVRRTKKTQYSPCT